MQAWIGRACGRHHIGDGLFGHRRNSLHSRPSFASTVRRANGASPRTRGIKRPNLVRVVADVCMAGPRRHSQRTTTSITIQSRWGYFWGYFQKIGLVSLYTMSSTDKTLRVAGSIPAAPPIRVLVWTTPDHLKPMILMGFFVSPALFRLIPRSLKKPVGEHLEKSP